MEIKHPLGILQREDGLDYLFRLAPGWPESEAGRGDNALSSELKTAEDIGLRVNDPQPLKLNIPTQSTNEL
jgi:hypothetical protein